MKYQIIHLNEFNTSAVFLVDSKDKSFKYSSTKSSRIYTMKDGRLSLKSDNSEPASLSQRVLLSTLLSPAFMHKFV